jgi:hypothetical protein
MRESNIIALFTVVAALTYPAAIRGQHPEPTEGAKDLASIANNIAQHVSGEQPGSLVRIRLERDRSVLERAKPEVLQTFEAAGYSPTDAKSGLAWSWYLLRVGKGAVPLTKELTVEVIAKQATQLGRLVVKSRPDGATVFVDGTVWPDPTNTYGFATVGERRVRVVKSGRQPAEKVCAVVRDRVRTFSADLGASHSQARCE